MDPVIAVAFFILISLLLVAVMAGGNNSGGKSDKDKSKKDVGPSRVMASTSEDTPPVPPRGPSSVPSACGGQPWFVTRWIHAWNNPDRPLGSSPQGSVGGSVVAGGGGDGSGSGPSGSSPQLRKRGRDEPARGLGPNMPPFHQAAIKGPSVPPPPPPPPPPAPPAQRQATTVVGNEVVWYQCSLCPRGFTSTRGLCGHMRAHPEREWRGAHPPPTFSRDEFHDVPGIGGAGPSSKGANDAALVPREEHQVPPETSVVNPPSGDEDEDAGNTSAEGGGEKWDFDLNKSPPRDPEDRER